MPPLSGIAALHHHLSIAPVRADGMDGVTLVPAADLPGPVRRLLDQTIGMTRALEEHWGTVLSATVLGSHRESERLRRCVVLSAGPMPVTVAGIDVMLPAVPPALRPCLADTTVPLGRLFRDHGLIFRTVAEAFFCVLCDAALAGQAGVNTGTPLFGRVARLDAGDGRTLARTVEVLARV